jgi:glycosyltransferase involved in cell wall biosynthesis
LHFKAGDPQALASCIRSVLNNPESLSAMRRNARSTFERHYSAEGNYAQLMDVYAKAARAAQSN